MKLRRLLLPTLMGLATMSTHAADWTTPAEAAHFRSTPDMATTVAVVASSDGTFDPATAHAKDRPVVLVQAGIHPGVIEGKDAGGRVSGAEAG